jgi:hypothetical protein
MRRWIVVAVLVMVTAVALRVVASVAHVDANPVRFVQSLGDENEPDENESEDSGDSSDSGDSGDSGDNGE